MTLCTMKLPDIGEGITEAELIEWNVEIGDIVQEDDILASVMTDKATVEIPAALNGKVVWRAGEPGDKIAIGSSLVKLEVTDIANDETAPDQPAAIDLPRDMPDQHEEELPDQDEKEDAEDLVASGRPLAAPAVRRRAREHAINLQEIAGSGPGGRVLHDDLDRLLSQNTAAMRPAATPPSPEVRDIKLQGLRRQIAERMALAKASIPHITIVEEVDVSALEDLRALLNSRHVNTRGKLTLLPFVMAAMARAIERHPGINGHFDEAEETLRLSEAVHIGIATQTASGLMVPVVRDVGSKTLWESAAEVGRLAEAARQGKATREELTGSTISLTSLGPLGAVATTPIINHPEIAIVGVNKIAVRPVWDGQAFQPRRMMNLSCSFDHRVIDGWDAAVFVQTLKELLETPALLFIDDRV